MEIVREISKFEIVCHTKTFYKTFLSLHCHDKYELCQVLENNCKFRVDGKEILASEGDIIAINAQVVHQFIIVENYTRIRICQLPLKLLLNLRSTLKPLKVHITAAEINEVPEVAKRLDMLFTMMEQEKKAELAIDNPFLQSLATSVYFLLERHFSEPYNIFSQEHDRQEFYKIIEYINNHFKEGLTIDIIAKNLYLSRGRLTAVFKKYAGEGTNEYLNKLRVKNANHLLSKGTSITEAALDSGFQSIRTFNNVYKSIMSMTPSEYIKKKK